MKGIVIIHFKDGGELAFTEEAFEEAKAKGLSHVKYYEHWLDRTEAKKHYSWIY